MKLNGGSCVLVGSLNPAILKPNWMVKHDILPDGENKSAFGIGTGGASMRFTMSDLTWAPGPERLAVDSQSAEADPGVFVAKILKKLEHTPVRGVGNNFQFLVSGGERISDAVPKDVLGGLASEENQVLGMELVVQLSHDSGAVIAMTLTFDGSSNLKDVKLNFHRDVTDASAAADAASAWSHDREDAIKLVEKLESLK